MNGLFTKEFIVTLKNNKLSLIAIPIFLTLGIINDQLMFLMIVPALFSILPLGTMTYDEISHWNLYVLSLPVSKKKIVTSKYIAVTVLAVFSAVFLGALLFILKNFDSTINNNMILFMLISALFIGVTIPCISIPINYKVGTTKGRFVYLLIVGGICGIFPNIILSDAASITKKLTDLTESPALLAVISVGTVTLMMLISWFLSVKIYEKKEA